MISHADKVMAAISDCAKAIKNVTTTEQFLNIRQLQQLVRLTAHAVHKNPSLFTTNVADNHLPFPRVFANNGDKDNRRLMRSMTLQTRPLLRLSAPQERRPIPVFYPSTRNQAKQRAATQPIVADKTLARNTRPHTSVLARSSVPILMGTRSSTRAQT